MLNLCRYAEGLPFDLGGKGVLNQKEFYMSGQDVFRIDTAGRVMQHGGEEERGGGGRAVAQPVHEIILYTLFLG
jgi:hypothetical protein